MNQLFRSFSLALVALLVPFTALHAQTALTQTTLTAAITSGTRTLPVASTTGILAGYAAVINNEAFSIYAVNTTSKILSVAPRGSSGTKAFAHVNGSMVLVGPTPAFISYDPSGTCTNGQGLFLYAPVINVVTGNQWLCSSVTGVVVPGFGNTSMPAAPTTAVASAAGLVTPSGPLFHITGTAAITGFNIPVGFDPKEGGTICAIPDGLFTTTNANNLALATTAVVSKPICWMYDPNATKPFFPTY